jgi:hypothetical protein
MIRSRMGAIAVRTGLAAAIAALVAAAPGLADQAALQGYGDSGGNVQTEITEAAQKAAATPGAPAPTALSPAPVGTPSGAQDTASRARAAGDLAVTGSDLEALCATGLGLLMAGSGLRVLVRTRPAD